MQRSDQAINPWIRCLTEYGGFPAGCLRIRGRLLRRSSFDIIDSFEQSVPYVKPRRILGNAKGIFSTRDGQPELMYIQDVSGASDVYLKGQAACEFRDSLTNKLVGMQRTKGLVSGGKLKLDILDPQGLPIGTVTKPGTGAGKRNDGPP